MKSKEAHGVGGAKLEKTERIGPLTWEGKGNVHTKPQDLGHLSQRGRQITKSLLDKIGSRINHNDIDR